MTNLNRYEEPLSTFWGLTNLQREVDSLFNEALRPTSRQAKFWSPSCDVRETKDQYLLSFDIPGVTPEDIQIEVKDHQLFVSGERKNERSDSDGTSHFSERSYGAFSRVFTLPVTIENDKIEASYTDGVLHISLPKVESEKPRRIQIGKGISQGFKKILNSSQEDKKVKAV